MQTTSSQTADSKIIASDLSKYWVHGKNCEKSLQAACSAPEAISRRIYKEDKWKCSRIFFFPQTRFSKKMQDEKEKQELVERKARRNVRPPGTAVGPGPPALVN